MTYAETVRRTVPDATDDLLAFANGVDHNRDPGGLVRISRVDRVRQHLDTLCRNGLARVVSTNGSGATVELLDSPPSESSARQEPTTDAPAPPKPATRQRAPRVPPKAGMDLRAPINQNEHMREIVNRLGGITQHVAMVAHHELGAVLGHRRLPSDRFGTVDREMTKDYLAGKTGLSARRVQDAMADAVRRGYFERLDFAQGGSTKGKGAKYRATLPAFVK